MVNLAPLWLAPTTPSTRRGRLRSGGSQLDTSAGAHVQGGEGNSERNDKKGSMIPEDAAESDRIHISSLCYPSWDREIT